MTERIYLSPPHMGGEELRFVEDAFRTNWIAPAGPHIDAFEREFADRNEVPCAVAVSSGTAAIHLALEILGVGPGDEVLCSTLTFCATANPVLYVGARPVFIDSEPASWNMDPQLLADELDACAERGRLPRAVIVVHLYGQSADFTPIAEACGRYGIPILEDAAEALGATYRDKPVGGLAALGAFSFNGNKIITTSGGGMLVSRNPEWIERARFLATQAKDPKPYYEHSSVGFNYRMSNVLAGVGRGQLRVLDSHVAARRANYDAYRAALSDVPGIDFMPEASYGRATRWLTCITIDESRSGESREGLRIALEEENIEARPVWKPLHLQPVYAGCRSRGGELAEQLFRSGLCLPSGSGLTEEQRGRVIDVVRSRCTRRAS